MTTTIDITPITHSAESLLELETLATNFLLNGPQVTDRIGAVQETNLFLRTLVFAQSRLNELEASAYAAGTVGTETSVLGSP